MADELVLQRRGVTRNQRVPTLSTTAFLSRLPVRKAILMYVKAY